VEFIIEPNGEILVNKHIAKIDLKPLVRHIWPSVKTVEKNAT
jgi:hypothetical protein